MTTPEQWAEAREAFEAGDSARSIARRLGVDHSTVVRRAKRGGWAVRTGEESGARLHRRVAAHPDAPLEEEPPARNDVRHLLGGDSAPALDLSNPAHQRAVLDAALGRRSGQAALDHVDALAADQREERAERLGYRGGLGWLRRARF